METHPRNVLIAGGSGMIGTRLKEFLERNNCRVALLSRLPQSGVLTFNWDPGKKILDPASIQWAHTIVNLAGENLDGGRWTARKKRKIVNSRIFATELLAESLAKFNHHVDSVIQASAVGIYGNTGYRIIHEDYPPGKDFLANTCVRWEKTADAFKNTGVRMVILRIGLVLSEDGGILPRLLSPLRTGIAPVFGGGEQYMSWIHVDDLCRMIVHATQNTFYNGVYNAVAPGPVSNFKFMQLLSHVRGKKHFMMRIPKWLLRLVLGEMSLLLTTGQRVSSEHVETTGFGYSFPSLGLALRELAGKV